MWFIAHHIHRDKNGAPMSSVFVANSLAGLEQEAAKRCQDETDRFLFYRGEHLGEWEVHPVARWEIRPKHPMKSPH